MPTGCVSQLFCGFQATASSCSGYPARAEGHSVSAATGGAGMWAMLAVKLLRRHVLAA